MTDATVTQETPDTRPRSNDAPVLEVDGLKKHFPIKKGIISRTVGHVYAVDGVSFSINQGETLGLVGESGCGKSTLLRLIADQIPPTTGEIVLDGATPPEARVRKEIAWMAQNPALLPASGASKPSPEVVRSSGLPNAKTS